jgi:hypothetical protein
MLFQDQSMHDCSSSESPTLSDDRSGRIPLLSRKPIPRKGHTKSRRGCLNCKRRRIKCNEVHPGEQIECIQPRYSTNYRLECKHCVKAGLQCEYPANIIQAIQRFSTSPHPQEVGDLRATPGIFVCTLGDHHFRNHLTITVYDGHALIPPLHHHCVSPSTSRWG